MTAKVVVRLDDGEKEKVASETLRHILLLPIYFDSSTTCVSIIKWKPFVSK